MQETVTPHFGRMNDPTAAAHITGPCGDDMEIYLYIREGRIEEVRYHTEGCRHTRVCGETAAAMAEGCDVWDALAISPRRVMDECEGLSEEGRHCAILAVTTLYRAIAEYLLMP